MKTNLIFKRQTTINGVNQTYTRVVPVDVPFINSGEGWILSGHTDCIEVAPELNISFIEDVASDTEDVITDASIEKPVLKLPEKFTSDITGTAKLVRSKGVIKIVARRGKSTYNQTTPNSICIQDSDKNDFFNQCRRFHGSTSGLYEFTISDGKPYEAWNKFMNNEYKRQQLRYTGGLK